MCRAGIHGIHEMSAMGWWWRHQDVTIVMVPGGWDLLLPRTLPMHLRAKTVDGTALSSNLPLHLK